MVSTFIKNQLKGVLVIAALISMGSIKAQLGLTWSEMGPNDIAGRTRAIIFDNTDVNKKRMFAAGVSGGLFKSNYSTTSGTYWTAVTGANSSLLISCMAQDVNSGVVYLGTGETFGKGGDGSGTSGFRGTGLYKFAALTGTFTQAQDSTLFGNINEVAVGSAGQVYVAAQKGFFVSTDGGTTFTKETASGTLPAMDVKVAGNGDVYYSAGTKDSSITKVFRQDLGVGAFNDKTPTNITNRGRIEIAISPVNNNYVYLSIAKKKSKSSPTAGGLSAILGSSNKGDNWTVVTLGTIQFDPLNTGISGVGDYANTIVAHPTIKDAFYIAGEVLFKWTQISSNPFGQGNFVQLGNPYALNSQLYLHSKIHDIKFSPTNPAIFYLATDAGIFVSDILPTGFPEQYTPFLQNNKDFNISQFNSVAFPNYPRVNQGTTNVVVPYAGVVGGAIGNSLTYIPGNLPQNGVMASISFGITDAYQSDFSKILPKTAFYSGAFGSILRTSDIDIAPFSNFYDQSYKGSSTGSPGGSSFANENTPFRLWENYNSTDSAIFYNEILNSNFSNNNSTKSTFSFANNRPQLSAKYDTIFVLMNSSKKANKSGAIVQTFTNTNNSATTFTVPNIRKSMIGKYDSVTVYMDSYKKTITTPVLTTYTNNNNTAASFTIANQRPFVEAKYDSIIIRTVSTKSLGPVPPDQTITIVPAYSNTNIVGYSVTGTTVNPIVYLVPSTFNDSIRFTFNTAPKDSSIFNIRIKYKHKQTIYIRPAYTGSLITSYVVSGNANNTPVTNNSITLDNPMLNDIVKFTFSEIPHDSSTFIVRSRFNYFQSIKIMPIYSGTAIVNYTLFGEANNSPSSNFEVKLNNNNLTDTIKYAFLLPPGDSCVISHAIKLRYSAGDVISLENKDISGQTFTTTTTLTNSLSANASVASMPIAKLPLRNSARIATGVNAKTATESPSIYVVKRPLNFAVNPDWIKIAGKNSRIDGPGGVASTTVMPVLGTTVTRLEWAHDGQNIYFATKLISGNNDSTFYLYRISHLDFIGDSADGDYGGVFTSDIDSANVSTMRKKPRQRTTALGRFKYPITSISLSNDDKTLLLTLGSYNNKTSTIYSSISDVTLLSMNNTDASNFISKNGNLPFIPAYSSLIEMTDNKIVLVGTENGIYSTSDITVASPAWSKESGGNFPNVPVFQIRQQTYPSYKCYNSGIIYAATHGRGIWSTDKYLTNYAIGINENGETLGNTNTVLLFPNPATEKTNIRLQASDNTSYFIKVYDISGRILSVINTQKLMAGESNFEINTSSFNSGVYFVSVEGSNNFKATTKLVITK